MCERRGRRNLRTWMGPTNSNRVRTSGHRELTSRHRELTSRHRELTSRRRKLVTATRPATQSQPQPTPPTYTVGVFAAVCGGAGRVGSGRARDPTRHTITTTAHTTNIYCRGVCCCLWRVGSGRVGSRARPDPPRNHNHSPHHLHIL